MYKMSRNHLFVLGCVLAIVLLSTEPGRRVVGCDDSKTPVDRRAKTGPANDNVVVHLFEWSWSDIARECKSLGQWGYWGVQVSPPQEDVIAAEWWSRYQPVSYKLESRSGTRDQFANMVKACAEHGISVVVDVVLNHMANQQQTKGRAGTRINSKCSYEGGYSCKHFHHYDCWGGSCGRCDDCQNCGNAECVGDDGKDPRHIYNCNLGGLPDLDTSHPDVQNTIAGYLNDLVDIGVAGIRVDASKHIDPKELSSILAKVKDPGLYVNQETILTGDCSCVRRQDYYVNGKVWEFNTPLLFHDVFHNANNMDKIRDMDATNPGGWQCGWAVSDYAQTFVVNHDKLLKPGDRVNTVTMFDEATYSLALLTLLAHPYGQPNILSSINFDNTLDDGKIKAPVVDPDDPLSPLKSVFDGNCGYWKVPGYPKHPQGLKPYLCEHRWPEVRNMVIWRKVAGLSGTLLFDIYEGSVLAITRGNWPGKAFFVVNAGGKAFEREVDTKGMPVGTYCNVVYTGPGNDDCYPCKSSCPSVVVVKPSGHVSISLGAQHALAFHVNSTMPAPSAAEVVVE